jgi:hypothetical protein
MAYLNFTLSYLNFVLPYLSHRSVPPCFTLFHLDSPSITLIYLVFPYLTLFHHVLLKLLHE